MKNIAWIWMVFSCSICLAQSDEYKEKKNKALNELSPFEKIISRDDPRELIYQDEDVVVFEGLRPQAPVHLLIVPKKRIATINELNDDDARIIGRMFLVAKKIATDYKINETGYRLTINTNEDAGQSVFHLHMHILGGMKLGPMMEQSYNRDK